MRIFAAVLTGLVLSICLTSQLSAQTIRVNAGGPAYTDSNGVAWAADTGYISGSTWGTSVGISGTSSSPLYQTCRYGEFSYQFAVSNGSYTVKLKFAEISQAYAGQRVFNVAINGTPVLTNFDIIQGAGAQFIALDKSFPVSVSGGQIRIQFTNGPANSPLVSAVEIVPSAASSSGSGSGSETSSSTASAAAVRVNAGGGAYTDSLGNAWSADTGAAGGNTWTTGVEIANTNAQPLYQSCRYGEFTYQFPVSNGNYTVNLKFAEVSQAYVGQRVFNVWINGAAVLTNFDIIAQAGRQFAAVDKSFPVSVSGGRIQIQFTNGPANSPLVSAIEIVPAGGSSTVVTPAPADPPADPPANTITVAPGGDLQAAIDAAQPGQTIVLQAGAVYTATYGFHLPNKSGSEYITIQSSALDSLPASGIRVGPANASSMAKVQTAGTNVFYTDSGAHHFRLSGLELAAAPGTTVDTVVAIGKGTETTDVELAHDIQIERCYIHGDAAKGSKRGVSVNGRNLTIRDSYISDFKLTDQDSQAISGWNGTQYVSILNNYLEASAENLMFFPDSTSSLYLPSDITVRGNLIRKPLSWKFDDPSFNGTRWVVKNLFEIKGAQRVTIDGNVLENCWSDAQVGFVFMLFSTQHTWGAVKDLTVTNNLIRHAAQGVDLCGDGCAWENVEPATNVLFSNNVFEDIGTAVWNGGNSNYLRLFQVIYNTRNVTIQHNTAIQSADVLLGTGTPNWGFVFRDNLVMNGVSGVLGSGTAAGMDTLQTYYPGAIFQGNAIVGANSAVYPSGNYFPSDIASVGFTSPSSGDYSLLPTSPLAGKATDGKNIGADWSVVSTAAAGALNGR